jgi:hypothetical protein
MFLFQRPSRVIWRNGEITKNGVPAESPRSAGGMLAGQPMVEQKCTIWAPRWPQLSVGLLSHLAE